MARNGRLQHQLNGQCLTMYDMGLVSNMGTIDVAFANLPVLQMLSVVI